MSPSKRDILLALAALGAGLAAPAAAQTTCPAPDLNAGRAIGEAYLAENSGTDLATLRTALLPNGFCDAGVAALRARVAADFREGAVFAYRGWRLSRTEAQLFALFAA